MHLSILIVNWNTKAKLQACLASIFRHPPTPDFEVIVVDNSSTDGSAEMVREVFPNVQLLALYQNTGYAKGNNIAFAAAKGERLLTLNPDTEFRDGALDRALTELAIRKDAGLVSIRLILPDGSTQQSVRGFPTIAGVFGAVSKLDRVFPKSPLGSYTLPIFDPEESQYAPQPMGTFLMFRREALEEVGDASAPFDESFPIFFNEVDLLYRLYQAGWPAYHCAEASCLHHHGSSTKQVRKSMIWESHLSLVRYLLKHTKGPARLLLPLAAVLSYAAAFVRAKGFHAGFRPDNHNLQLEHH